MNLDELDSGISKLFILVYESDLGKKLISKLYKGVENLKGKDTAYIKEKWEKKAGRMLSEGVTGQTKISSKAPNDRDKIKDAYVARIGDTGAPPWSQAWGWGSQASAWWPGLCPRDPAGRSPKERRGPALLWAHHSQEGSEGAGAV